MKNDTRDFITGLSSYLGEFFAAIIKGFMAGYKSKD